MQNLKTNWLKAFEIHSPSTAYKYGPIINIQGRVRPMLSDHNSRLMTWIIITTEEFYYQNSFYLTSKNKDSEIKMNESLNTSRAEFHWQNRLTEFRLIGSGNFGNVFLAKDEHTGERLAIKEIGPVSGTVDHLIKETTSIMHERNELLKSNDSHFVVRFYASFQDDLLKSYWLVFEFCIGSVQDYVNKMQLDTSSVLEGLWTSKVIRMLYQTDMQNHKLDVQSIAIIFLFEMCCGLDYLAKRSIVHNDIKPANILISQTGHFKITDLGVTERIKWIDRKSSMHFLHPELLKEGEMEDSTFSFRGTVPYTDPETQLFISEYFNQRKVYRQIKSKYFPWKNPSQDFLTDLYSVALSMLDVLFYGVNPILPNFIPISIANRFNIDIDDTEAMRIWWLRNAYDDDVRENYLHVILDNVITQSNSSIIDFLKSIFLPRPIRATEYTKEIQIVKLKTVETRRCIDIEKVKELQYYKTYGITEYNIFKFKMSAYFINIFNTEKLEERPIVANKISDLAEILTRDRAKKLGRLSGKQIKMSCLDYQDVKFKI